MYIVHNPIKNYPQFFNCAKNQKLSVPLFSLLLNQRGIGRTLSSNYLGFDQSEHVVLVVFSIYFEFQEVFKKGYPEFVEF